MTNGNELDIPVNTMAETENYTIWSAEEPDGEVTYHLELGPVTAHFFQEEWEEFLEMVESIGQLDEVTGGDVDEDDIAVELELDWGSLFFDHEEWGEFQRLMGQLS